MTNKRCPSREAAGKPVCHSMDLTCPRRDAVKPHVVLPCSKDHLSSPSDSGNRWNSFCIVWILLPFSRDNATVKLGKVGGT